MPDHTPRIPVRDDHTPANPHHPDTHHLDANHPDTNSPLTYNAVTLDRAPDRRADPGWLQSQLTRPDARVIHVHQDQIVDTSTDPNPPITTNGTPTRPTNPHEPAIPTGLTTPTEPTRAANPHDPATSTGPLDPQATVFLGLDGDVPVFATETAQPTGPTRDLRAIVTTLDPNEAATLAYARGMLHWTRNQRFCGTCGHPTTPQDGGHVRVCIGCGKLHFPRIEPAVITLVTWHETCLLGRHHGSSGYSTLAGFVEPGENLETAVRREIREEAGVSLTDVHYQASQTWPFPSGLMIAFRAEAASPTIHVDHNELDDARWFTPDEVRAMPNPRTDSVEHFLITRWLDESTHS